MTRAWLTEHGLPQNTVNALAQTRDGFLWIGTNGGLARFDGVRFRNFGLQDGLASVRISALAEDSFGTLWVGTTGGGVSRWESGRFTTFRPEDGIPTVGDIVSMTADKSGGVWIGTTDGLVFWKNGKFRILGEREGIPREQVSALTLDAAESVWAATLEDGIFKQSGDRFERVLGESSPGGAYSIFGDREGSVWVGGGNGKLSQWKDGSWKLFGRTEGLPNESVGALAEDEAGNLWAGMQRNGFYRKNGDRLEPALDDPEIASTTARALLVDRFGSIWAGMNSGGLVRVSRRVAQFIEVKAPLGMGAVSSVVEDAEGRVWLIANNQGVLRIDGGTILDVGTAARGDRGYCGAAMGDGSVWVGGEQYLTEYRNDMPPRRITDPPILGEALRALCPDGDTLWIGTYYSALLKHDAGGVQMVAPKNSFGGSITTLVRESPGVLWIGSFGGLFRWQAGKTESWTERDGLMTKSVLALHRDADGTLWIGTLGGGLARMKGGRFAHITTRHGLVDDIVSQVVADDFGCLWLGTNRGIMRVERRELDLVADGKAEAVYPVIIDRQAGILSDNCTSARGPNTLKARDGKLYFATTRGVAVVDPREFLEGGRKTPVQPLVEDLQVDGNAVERRAPIVILPGPHRVEISYTAPALRDGEWMRFRHRLEGVDSDWVITRGPRRASYAALRPGQYVFAVDATDGSGDWNGTPTSVAFTVQPYLWQTLWFRAGGAALLAGSAITGMWGFFRRKHRLQIAALERERAQHAELAHAGRVALLGELSASIAHELKQPLTAILSNAQAGIRFLKNDEVGEVHAILSDIAEADRRASEIIGRMREMVKKGEAQLEARDLNADLHQVLMLLRSDLAARNVSVATELAPGLPLVSGDHIQLQQVLLNLIMNGCDAMQAVPVEERRLFIETAREGTDFARVSVTDRGPGIAPGVLSRIFEPFYTTKSQGLGMGLSICQAIIKAHGGKLWVENHPERGAAFHFTLRVGEQGQ